MSAYNGGTAMLNEREYLINMWADLAWEEAEDSPIMALEIVHGWKCETLRGTTGSAMERMDRMQCYMEVEKRLFTMMRRKGYFNPGSSD